MTDLTGAFFQEGLLLKWNIRHAYTIATFANLLAKFIILIKSGDERQMSHIILKISSTKRLQNGVWCDLKDPFIFHYFSWSQNLPTDLVNFADTWASHISLTQSQHWFGIAYCSIALNNPLRLAATLDNETRSLQFTPECLRFGSRKVIFKRNKK